LEVAPLVKRFVDEDIGRDAGKNGQGAARGDELRRSPPESPTGDSNKDSERYKWSEWSVRELTRLGSTRDAARVARKVLNYVEKEGTPRASRANQRHRRRAIGSSHRTSDEARTTPRRGRKGGGLRRGGRALRGG
jgi:hypothetical protein